MWCGGGGWAGLSGHAHLIADVGSCGRVPAVTGRRDSGVFCRGVFRRRAALQQTHVDLFGAGQRVPGHHDVGRGGSRLNSLLVEVLPDDGGQVVVVVVVVHGGAVQFPVLEAVVGVGILQSLQRLASASRTPASACHVGRDGADDGDDSDEAGQAVEDVALVDGRIEDSGGDGVSQNIPRLVYALVKPDQWNNRVLDLLFKEKETNENPVKTQQMR